MANGSRHLRWSVGMNDLQAHGQCHALSWLSVWPDNKTLRGVPAYSLFGRFWASLRGQYIVTGDPVSLTHLDIHVAKGTVCFTESVFKAG